MLGDHPLLVVLCLCVVCAIASVIIGFACKDKSEAEGQNCVGNFMPLFAVLCSLVCIVVLFALFTLESRGGGGRRNN
jgi:hypothetical protein